MATNRDACPAQLGSAFSQDRPVGVCEPNRVWSSPGPEFPIGQPPQGLAVPGRGRQRREPYRSSPSPTADTPQPQVRALSTTALTFGEQHSHGAELQLQPDEDVAGVAIH